jgi:hypothetical protein
MARSSARQRACVAKCGGMHFVLMLALTTVAPAGALAAAKPVTYTLGGSGSDGFPYSPDSYTRAAEVGAVSKGRLIRGMLETVGNPPGPGGSNHPVRFSGHVTCMTVSDEGRRVAVGAYGSVTRRHEKLERLPGKYAQILTVEFGEFPNVLEPSSPLTDTFGVLGAEGEGIKSTSRPNCANATFTAQDTNWTSRLGGGFSLTTN